MDPTPLNALPAKQWAANDTLVDPATLVDSSSYYGSTAYWPSESSGYAAQQSYYHDGTMSYDAVYTTQGSYYDGAQSYDTSGYDYSYGTQRYDANNNGYEAEAQTYDGYGYETEAQSCDASASGYDTRTYEAASDAYPAAGSAPGWDEYYGGYYQDPSAEWDGYSYGASYQQAAEADWSQQHGYSTDQPADSASAEPSQWEEVFDPQSSQVYYVNRVTLETTWELPA